MSEISLLTCNLPERLPDGTALHHYFTTAILLDCSKLETDASSPQVLQQRQAAMPKLSNLRQAYTAVLLRYDLFPQDLQTIIASFTSAVLRVSQSLEGPASKELVQQALEAAEEVHSSLQSQQRCEQLLSLGRVVSQISGAEGGSPAAADSCQGRSCVTEQRLPSQQPHDWFATLDQCMPTRFEGTRAAAAHLISSGLGGSVAATDTEEAPVICWF